MYNAVPRGYFWPRQQPESAALDGDGQGTIHVRAGRDWRTRLTTGVSDGGSNGALALALRGGYIPDSEQPDTARCTLGACGLCVIP